MTDWHDRLPPIPSQRIFNEVIREGGLRKDRRRQRRQRVIAFGGSLAAVAAVVTGIVLTNDAEQDPNASSRPTNAAASATTTAAAAATTSPNTPAVNTTSPTGAASGTTSPASTAAAEATLVAVESTHPVSAEVAVSTAEIWEQPATGVECGPTTVEVTYQPDSITLGLALVLLGDPGSGQAVPMTVTDNRATATIGPYDPETLDDGTQQVLAVTVSYVDTAGEQGSIRSTQTVTLHDCP